MPGSSFSGVPDERLVRGITRQGELLEAPFSRGGQVDRGREARQSR